MKTRRPAPAPRKSAAGKRAPSKDEPAPPFTEARRARLARRRNHSKEEILAAARRVLLEKGIGATTLEAVAREAGLSKAALYYYYPSKDALFFELVFGTLQKHAHMVHDAVEDSESGGAALGAIIRESMRVFADNLDDFRLAFLHGQVAGQGGVNLDETQFARLRPLNELMFSEAAEKLGAGGKEALPNPRLAAFLAYTSALGLLTMKGLAVSMNDPLLYTDEELTEGLAGIFAAAARA